MVRKLSRRFATNRELIRILLFIFKATTSQKVYALKQLSFPAPPIEINRHHAADRMHNLGTNTSD